MSQTTTTPKGWVTFTFNSPALYKITNLFRNTGLNIAYKPSNTIRHILQPKNNFDPFTQSGIYQIRCVSCNRMYVGQSGCEIGTRYKEHTRYICNNNPASAYSQHILNHNHEFVPAIDTLQLLKRCSKGKIMNCWETFFIQRLKQKTDLTHCGPVFFSSILITNHQFKVKSLFFS
jgi:hypothetical protein